MFPQKLQALLQAALPVHSCRSVHRLASLQELAALPPQRKQRLLYPFSGLEAYLDRCVCGRCGALAHGGPIMS